MNVKEDTIERIKKIDFTGSFIVDDKNQKEYSYNEFFGRCYSIAQFLSKQAIDDVFAVLDNSIELLELYFAVILAKKRIVVVDPEKGNDEISSLYHEYKTAYPIINKNDKQENYGIFDFSNVDCTVDNKEILLACIEEYDFNEAYLTTFTSGTSGNTKGVKNSLNNLFGTIYSFLEKMDVEETGAFLHLMPMTYMAGILNSIFMPFVMGYQIVISSRFSIRFALSFWRLVEKYNINMLWMSPMMITMVDKVDRSDRYENYCKSHNICFLVGTAPLMDDVRKRFENRYGATLFASYGLSETLFISVETARSINACRKDNVGEILSGVDYIINEDGELGISVPWMFCGYTNENTSDYFDGDYYMTGDLAAIEDGILRIVGRKKDLIIRGGLNISPKLIEECISELDIFVEFSIFGRKNSFGEEEVCCAYVIKEVNENVDAEKKVSQQVLSKLGKNYSINSFIKMNALPRNINGKVDKGVLKGILT